MLSLAKHFMLQNLFVQVATSYILHILFMLGKRCYWRKLCCHAKSNELDKMAFLIYLHPNPAFCRARAGSSRAKKRRCARRNGLGSFIRAAHLRVTRGSFGAVLIFSKYSGKLLEEWFFMYHLKL